MLTQKQHKLLQFIEQTIKEQGISPSFEEMKTFMELKSKSCASKSLNNDI